jgi:hypothetical protein
MPTATTARIQNDAVILYLSIGRLRTRRKIAAGHVQSDIDPEMLHVSKDILEAPELAAIGQHDNELKAWIRARCLPSPFTRKGIALLPVRLIEDVMAKIDQNQAERLPLIDAFCLAYELRKAQAREKLHSAYDETDYPPIEAVRRTFTFECQLWELSTPGQMQSINRDLYQRELVKMNNMWAEASAMVTNVLLQEFRKLTDHLSDRLQPGPDGKAKRLHDTTLTNLTQWLDLFQARNLTDDADLVATVQRARAIIHNITPEQVRETGTLRNQLASDFADITKALDEQIVNAPIRAIDFSLEVGT